MDRCDPRSRPLATNRAAHRAEKISAAYRNPRHRRQGIPGLRCRATPNTANLLSENRPGVTDAGVSLRRLTSRNSLTLKNFSQRGVEDGLERPRTRPFAGQRLGIRCGTCSVEGDVAF